MSSTANPILNYTIEPDNTGLDSSFNGLYIQGKSRVKVTINAQAQNGATIEDYWVDVDSKWYFDSVSTSEVLYTSGEKSVKITVYDSNGLSTTVTDTITVLPYLTPVLVNGDCFRCDLSGAPDPDGERIRVIANVKYTSVMKNDTQENGYFVSYRFKENDGEWSNYIAISSSADSQTPDFDEVLNRTFSKDSTYEIELEVMDFVVGRSTLTFPIPTSTVTFHLGYGGLAVAVGRYADVEKANRGIPNFTSAWKAFFENGIEGALQGEKYEEGSENDDIEIIVQNCQEGMTVIETTSVTTNLPHSDFFYSPGIVLKRTTGGANDIFVFLISWLGERIAYKAYESGNGSVWRFITFSEKSFAEQVRTVAPIELSYDDEHLREIEALAEDCSPGITYFEIVSLSTTEVTDMPYAKDGHKYIGSVGCIKKSVDNTHLQVYLPSTDGQILAIKGSNNYGALGNWNYFESKTAVEYI